GHLVRVVRRGRARVLRALWFGVVLAREGLRRARGRCRKPRSSNRAQERGAHLRGRQRRLLRNQRWPATICEVRRFVETIEASCQPPGCKLSLRSKAQRIYMTRLSDTFRIAIAQLNPTVGDIAGNLAKAREARAQAAGMGADLILFTELFVAGYPPEDLVQKPAFVTACEEAVLEFAGETNDGGPGVVIGTPLKRTTGVHNAIMVLDGGEVIAERYKIDLPNYGEFDEKRVFESGPQMGGPINFRGVRIGIPICEDIWGELGVCETLAEAGAEILLVPNGSPYHRGKVDRRQQVVIRQVIETELPVIYANMVGGQDELVFDGASFAIQADKSLAFQMPEF